jgi:uncharacterized protein
MIFMDTLLQNNNIRKSLTAVFILLAVFLLIKSINELKGAPDEGVPESTISVSGEGKVFAVPDIANFSFILTEERKSVKEAQNSLSEDISYILDSLDKFGIDKKDIKTLSYNVYPRYEYQTMQKICPEGFSCPPSSKERVLVGYEVSQNISIKLRDIDQAGEVLDSLGGLGIDNLNGPNFEIEDREKFEREARKMAIDNAKEKAKDLSKDLGVRLVRVVSFSEGGRFYAQTRNFALDESIGIGAGFATPEIPAGESEIYSSVQIIYEIR